MDDSQKKQAKIISLRLLAASPKSRSELAKKLTDKGFDWKVIQETLEGLQEQGLVGDQTYAQNLASRFIYDKPSGHRKIAFELKRHGVPAKIREDILEKLSPDEEIQRAREIGLAKWDSFRNLPSEKRKKRVYDYLVRRGFDFQTARDLVEEFRVIEKQ